MASGIWKGIAGAAKQATVIPGRLGISDDEARASPQPLRASVSYGGPTPLAYTPFYNKVPASQTVAPLPGAFGSVVAAQDVCAADLKCLGVQVQELGGIALLYPGCSAPRVITDVRDAPGTTTWAKKTL